MITCLKHRSEDCKECLETSPKEVYLKDHLVDLYNQGLPKRYVYISDLENNLTKIRNHFNESVEFKNQGCTISLVKPVGCSGLNGAYDIIFVDHDLDQEIVLVLDHVELTHDGEVKAVHATKQVLL